MNSSLILLESSIAPIAPIVPVTLYQALRSADWSRVKLLEKELPALGIVRHAEILR